MKENVLIYRTTIDASKKLNDKQFREFFDKYFDYVLNDVPFETDDLVVDVLFTSIKVTIDKSLKNYQNCVNNGNKGAKYGKMGGRPKKEKTPTETPTETPRDNNTSDGYFDDNKPQEKPQQKPQEKPQQKPHNDNVDVNDNVNEDEYVDVNVDSGISTNNNTTYNDIEEKEEENNMTCMNSHQDDSKVETTGKKSKVLLESFVDGDKSRFPTIDELRAIFILENINFSDEDFKNNSSGLLEGKYKLSPKYATMSVLKYLKPAITNHGYLCDSDNKDIQNAVISYINKNKLNVVIGNNF